jgi:hypothetical protein
MAIWRATLLPPPAKDSIPDCWFLRLPILSNRVRLSCMDMVKIS